MQSPFVNPTEQNPFQNVKTIPVAVVVPEVIIVEQVVVKKDRKRWLEIPGACCLSYFCGPCYMFAHLCCMICK